MAEAAAESAWTADVTAAAAAAGAGGVERVPLQLRRPG
jgi:hypothetical protein